MNDGPGYPPISNATCAVVVAVVFAVGLAIWVGLIAAVKQLAFSHLDESLGWIMGFCGATGFVVAVGATLIRWISKSKLD